MEGRQSFELETPRSIPAHCQAVDEQRQDNKGENISALNLAFLPSHEGSLIRRKRKAGVVLLYKGSSFNPSLVIMAKAKKKRADKYDNKLAINGSFDDVIKVSVAGNPAPKPKPVKPKKKK